MHDMSGVWQLMYKRMRHMEAAHCIRTQDEVNVHYFPKLKDKRLSAVRQLSNRLVGSVNMLSTRLAGLTGILGE